MSIETSGEKAPGNRSSLPDFKAAQKSARFRAGVFFANSMSVGKSSKHQVPRSKEARNFNIQSKSHATSFGAWTLEVSLELGCWSLVIHFCSVRKCHVCLSRRKSVVLVVTRRSTNQVHWLSIHPNAAPP